MADTTKRRPAGRAVSRARPDEETRTRRRPATAQPDGGGVGQRIPRGRGAAATSLLDTLRERIARQQIPPASKLREHEVALEFGVPRTQVREAFSALEQRGLIERIPNRGAIVTRLDIAQVFHIYQVREVLEGLCVRLATENSSPDAWQELLELFEGPMATFVEASDFDAFIAGYERFRRRAMEAADNAVLAQMLDSIYEKTQVLIRRIIILPGRAKMGLSEHVAVLRAMRAGDAQAAEDLRRRNMRSACEYLNRYQSYIL